MIRDFLPWVLVVAKLIAEEINDVMSWRSEGLNGTPDTLKNFFVPGFSSGIEQQSFLLDILIFSWQKSIISLHGMFVTDKFVTSHLPRNKKLPDL